MGSFGILITLGDKTSKLKLYPHPRSSSPLFFLHMLERERKKSQLSTYVGILLDLGINNPAILYMYLKKSSPDKLQRSYWQNFSLFLSHGNFFSLFPFSLSQQPTLLSQVRVSQLETLNHLELGENREESRNRLRASLVRFVLYWIRLKKQVNRSELLFLHD